MEKARWFSLLMTLLLSSAMAGAQAPAKSYTPAKTPWGDPDIQGTFTNATITPFERPAEFVGRDFLTEKEAGELERRAAAATVDVPPREGRHWYVQSVLVRSRVESSSDGPHFTRDRSPGWENPSGDRDCAEVDR